MILAYDYNIWFKFNIKSPIKINLRTHPNLLMTGVSGSGKSYAMEFLLRNVLSDYKVEITFCNFKKSDDFKFLSDYKKYYTYKECGKGLEEFYTHFKDIQDEDIEFSGKYHLIVFDEFPAFIMSTTLEDKKKAEMYKMMISELLMLCRSYGYGVWLVMQRPDSTFLANGARSNFHSVITVGNINRDMKTMLYSGEELFDRLYQVGEGICWIDGIGLKEIKFPKIKDKKYLDNQILNRLGDCDRREASD